MRNTGGHLTESPEFLGSNQGVLRDPQGIKLLLELLMRIRLVQADRIQLRKTLGERPLPLGKWLRVAEQNSQGSEQAGVADQCDDADLVSSISTPFDDCRSEVRHSTHAF